MYASDVQYGTLRKLRGQKRDCRRQQCRTQQVSRMLPSHINLASLLQWRAASIKYASPWLFWSSGNLHGIRGTA